MTKLYSVVRLTFMAGFILTVTSIGQAQAVRTWVSGVGDDINPCSRTAPCRTWAGAISKTAVSGMMNAIDPGSFGAVTITKHITIDGGGQMSATTNASVNGININDSASGTPNTAVVNLRNLAIDALANGTNGINFTAGKTVTVENCVITGNTAASTNGAGIRVSLTVTGANLNVRNTSLVKNRVGISATTTTGSVNVNIDNCSILNNSGDGVFLDARANGSIRNSNLSFNGSAGLSLNNNAANSVTVSGTQLNNNNIGMFVGIGTTVRLGSSTVSQNTTNFQNNGTIVSFCNNETETNPIPGTVTTNCLK